MDAWTPFQTETRVLHQLQATCKERGPAGKRGSINVTREPTDWFVAPHHHSKHLQMGCMVKDSRKPGSSANLDFLGNSDGVPEL